MCPPAFQLPWISSKLLSISLGLQLQRRHSWNEGKGVVAWHCTGGGGKIALASPSAHSLSSAYLAETLVCTQRKQTNQPTVHRLWITHRSMPRTERTVLDRMIGSLGETGQSYASDRSFHQFITSKQNYMSNRIIARTTYLAQWQDHYKTMKRATPLTGSLHDTEQNYISDRIITRHTDPGQADINKYWWTVTRAVTAHKLLPLQ